MGKETFIFEAPMDMRPITINLELEGGKTSSHLLNSEGNTISTFQKVVNRGERRNTHR